MRRPAAASWSALGFERLEALPFHRLVDAHLLAASHGFTTGTGPVKHHFLDAIWAEYQRNVRERIDPIYTATRFVKHTVMHRPWRDANRRTSFLWASTHLRAFGRLVRIDSTEARAFKQRVKNESFATVYTWFEKEWEKGAVDEA